MNNKQASRLDIALSCLLGLVLGTGLSLIYIYQTGGFQVITYTLEIVNPYGSIDYANISGLTSQDVLDLCQKLYPNCVVSLINEDKSYESKFPAGA